MNTPSHFLLTAAVGTLFKDPVKDRSHKIPALRMSGLLIGSVIPDLLLTLLAIFTIARDMFSGAFDIIDFGSLEPGQPTPQEWLDASLTIRLFDVWFFENPWVIALQNLFHSPLLLVLYVVVAYLLWRRGVRGAGWFFWLSCGALMHTVVDIPLHVDDGPLLLFPLNWDWRFVSPVSYWDQEHYGREWSYFESALDLLLIFYLIWHYRQSMGHWLRRQFSKS